MSAKTLATLLCLALVGVILFVLSLFFPLWLVIGVALYALAHGKSATKQQPTQVDKAKP